MLSIYATRSLMCFVTSFLALILYFSLSKPDYVLEEKYKDKVNDKVISIRLILIYSLLYSSGLALVFMAIDIGYHQYFKNNI